MAIAVATALLAMAAACGTQPNQGTGTTTDAATDVIATDVEPDTAPDVELDVEPDTAPDVEMDVEPDTPPDVAPDTDSDANTCGPMPSMSCVSGCGSDALAMPECIDGTWACPPDYPVNLDTCDGCIGRPPRCCDVGEVLVDPICEGSSWTCEPPAGFTCPASPDLMLGTWEEVQRTDCDGTVNAGFDDPIAELRFMGDGRFDLTFRSGMFETFRHYWGTYSYRDGRLEMQAEGGNMSTDGLDLSGSVILVDEGAQFFGFTFGEGSSSGAAPPCSYTLTLR